MWCLNLCFVQSRGLFSHVFNFFVHIYYTKQFNLIIYDHNSDKFGANLFKIDSYVCTRAEHLQNHDFFCMFYVKHVQSTFIGFILNTTL